MKRLALLAAVAGVAAIVAAGGLSSTGRVSAVPQPFTIAYDVGMDCGSAVPLHPATTCTGGDPTAVGSSPNVETVLRIDCGGLGCANPPMQPFFDIAVQHYGGAIHTPINAAPEAPLLAKPKIGSKVGELTFQISTNQLLGADNVSAVTGGPPVCGAGGSIQRTFPLISAITDVSLGLSNGTNVAGGPLNDTVEDLNANGIVDGADLVPDYIKTTLGSQKALLVARSFGVARIVPGTVETDVNFLTLDLGIASGKGYVAVTTLGNTSTTYEPGASQSGTTCSPFISQVLTYGTSQPGVCTVVDIPNGCDGIGKGAYTTNACADCGGGTKTRVIGAGGVPAAAVVPGNAIHYALSVSATEDVDEDGVPIGIDRCPAFTDANFAAAVLDTDFDGLGDNCDPVPGSKDNNGSGGPAAYPTKQTVSNLGPPPAGPHIGDTKGSATWDPDQDIDGDGIHNYLDNCPSVRNRDQKDQDSDAIGNVCDLNPFSVHAAAGAPFLTVASRTRDANSGGAAGAAAGEDFPVSGVGGGFCNNAAAPAANITTCNVPARGVVDGNEGPGDSICDDGFLIGAGSESNTGNGGSIGGGADVNPPVCTAYLDSNDDGFADLFAASFNVLAGGTAPPAGAGPDLGLPAVDDINSDSDADGCSDNYETRGGCQGLVSATTLPCPAPTPPNTHNADVNCNGIIDGAEDIGPGPANAIPDWKDDVLGTSGTLVIGAKAHTSGNNPNGGGSPDSDFDNCSNRRENLVPLASGGSRNPLNPYDFADVPTSPFDALGERDKIIGLDDVLGDLFYSGVSSSLPNKANLNGVTYGGSAATVTIPGDDNNDGRSNGAEYDRVANNGNGLTTIAPDGSIGLDDVLAVLAQSGANCSAF